MLCVGMNKTWRSRRTIIGGERRKKKRLPEKHHYAFVRDAFYVAYVLRANVASKENSVMTLIITSLLKPIPLFAGAPILCKELGTHLICLSGPKVEYAFRLALTAALEEKINF